LIKITQKRRKRPWHKVADPAHSPDDPAILPGARMRVKAVLHWGGIGSRRCGNPPDLKVSSSFCNSRCPRNSRPHQGEAQLAWHFHGSGRRLDLIKL
jgi:hypothetical protein